MPSVKHDGAKIDLGELEQFGLEILPGSIFYTKTQADGSESSFRVSPTENPHFILLREFRNGQRQHLRVQWKDCSSSVQAALKRKFRIQAPLSSTYSKQIARIVSALPRWHQSEAQKVIESELTDRPEADQALLLRDLETRLSGTRQEQRLSAIFEWKGTSVEAIENSIDTRSELKRERELAVSQAMDNPHFKEAYGAILDMMPDRETRIRVRPTTFDERRKRYHSILMDRVFAGGQGPLISIQDIHAKLKPLFPQVRYRAIHDWRPQSPA